jgi:hypothetical protein
MAGCILCRYFAEKASEGGKRMNEGHDRETKPFERAGKGQDMPDRPPLPGGDAATPPGLHRRHDRAGQRPDADTPPAPVESRYAPGQPEWPIEQSRLRRPDASGPGYSLGIAVVGVVLVLALVAGTLLAIRGIAMSSQGGGNGAVPGTPSVTARTPVARPSATASVPSPTPKPTATATALPLPPQLSVSPQEATAQCLVGRYPDLAASNRGGGELNWTAATSDAAVRANPASGTLAAGAVQTVMLSGLHVGQALTVTFSSDGGDATVTITCR